MRNSEREISLTSVLSGIRLVEVVMTLSWLVNILFHSTEFELDYLNIHVRPSRYGDI